MTSYKERKRHLQRAKWNLQNAISDVGNAGDTVEGLVEEEKFGCEGDIDDVYGQLEEDLSSKIYDVQAELTHSIQIINKMLKRMEEAGLVPKE